MIRPCSGSVVRGDLTGDLACDAFIRTHAIYLKVLFDRVIPTSSDAARGHLALFHQAMVLNVPSARPRI
jgi:hypothetical protein